MANRFELFEHAQRYIREVMADRLREEGFVSYKGEDIHWYRLVNNEVVQVIYFVTRETVRLSFFKIYYGCHPLWIPPIFQKSPYMYGIPGYEQMNNAIPEKIPGSTPCGFTGLSIYGMFNRPYRVPDVMIMCPQDKNNGLDILEDLFPVMDQLTTPLACYEMHKHRRMGEIENDAWLSMSTYFVDEVLFWEDTSLYPYCEMYVTARLNWLEEVKEEGKLTRKEDQKELLRLQALKQVLDTGNRQEYLQTFHLREQETLRLLQKYTGI